MGPNGAHKVVIVGGGFGGLRAARHLGDEPVEVTLIDRRNFHLFQPLTYRDKGNLATIGRARAVADIKGMELSGFPAWVTWLAVHLWYLVGSRTGLWSSSAGRSAS